MTVLVMEPPSVYRPYGALLNLAITASIPYLVKDEELQKANSLNSGLGELVVIVGGLLAETIYTFLGIGVILLIKGISYPLLFYCLNNVSILFHCMTEKVSFWLQFIRKSKF
jgi:hypothetical protein